MYDPRKPQMVNHFSGVSIPLFGGPPLPLPYKLPKVPHPKTGARIIGGAGGDTLIIGADGHIRFIPGDPDTYFGG